MNEQYMRNLINLLQMKFQSTIVEFPQIEGISYRWGLISGDTNNGITVLSFWNNRDIYNVNARINLANYLRGYLNGAMFRVVHIVLSENTTDYNHMISSYEASNAQVSQPGNLVVEDMLSGQTVYYSSGLENINNYIRECIAYIGQQNRNRKKFIPWVTYAMIGINVLIFLICVLTSDPNQDFYQTFLIAAGGNVRQLVLSGEYYRLITSMFLHGGFSHIACNMFSLYCIGPLVEQVYGKTKYILMYFISGLAGSILSLIFMSNQTVSIGASGAIFGLLGVVLVFAVKTRKQIGKNLLINIVVVILINLFIGFTIPNIDYFAHIGGLIGGVISGILFWNSK